MPAAVCRPAPPILRARAGRAGACVLEGTAVVGVAQDADGVVATVPDVATGRERALRAKYLVGADGARSKVRELLGIELDGRGVFSNSITIYFHAPMALIAGKKWPQTVPDLYSELPRTRCPVLVRI